MIIEIVQTTSEHIHILARTIREDDKKEIEAYGFSCMKGLWRSYKNGTIDNTVLVDGKVAACFGCGGSFLGMTGRPWFLTSYEVDRISPITFYRIYKSEVGKMLDLFPILCNYVWADHVKAVRLLSLVGFSIGEPEKFGNGIFRKFEMRA